MISNVSSRWRRRLCAGAAVWAAALVAVAFLSSGATVREQVGAAEAREDLDAVLGAAAGYLSGGVYVLSAGPLEVSGCEVTAVRSGVSLGRTLMVEGSDDLALEGLVDRLGLSAASEAAVWSGVSADYVRVTLSESAPGVARLRAVSGCRPADGRFGVVAPVAPGGDGSWEYGGLDCPGGGRLVSWTSPSREAPLAVHETSGRCV